MTPSQAVLYNYMKEHKNELPDFLTRDMNQIEQILDKWFPVDMQRLTGTTKHEEIDLNAESREKARKVLMEFSPVLLESFRLFMHEEYGEFVSDFGIKDFLKHKGITNNLYGKR